MHLIKSPSGKVLDEQGGLFCQPKVEADRDEEECRAFLTIQEMDCTTNPDTALKSSNTFTHHRIILFPAVLLYCPRVCRLQACTYPQNSISLLNLHGRCLLTNARFDLKLIIHWFGVALFLWSWEQPISMVFQLIWSLEESGLRVKGLVDLF